MNLAYINISKISYYSYFIILKITIILLKLVSCFLKAASSVTNMPQIYKNHFLKLIKRLFIIY